jgi:L-ascorbate metabolism protein UlaG (beta-lactamase superfamily)
MPRSPMRIACIEADLPYHSGPLGAHMHDPSTTRPGEVGTMIGKWLGALLSTPTRQIYLSGETDAEVDLMQGSRGHGL